MSTKHTPGRNWIARPISKGATQWEVAPLHPSGDGSTYAAITGRLDESDARLIAASPELLAALQAIEAGFADGSIKFTKKRQADSDPYHPANTLMCAALAKTTGAV